MTPIDKILDSVLIRIGVSLSVIWGFGTVIFLVFTPGNGDFDFVSLVAFILPLVLIWCTIFIGLAIQGMREETAAINADIQDLKKTKSAPIDTGAMARDFEIKQQLDQIAELTRRNDDRMSALAQKTLDDTGHTLPPRQTAALVQTKIPTPDDLNQADLPLPMSNQDGRLPISIPEFIKALNFPNDANDKEGFRVLRRALEDFRTAPLISAAKDLLTMLSENGIYMDDFSPDRAKPELWRAFAHGKRGKTVDALGGLRDEAALALTNARFKNDPHFRELAHIFMQQFVSVLETFEKTADDSEIHQMAETRTALCFMLLGRVSGAFNSR